MRKAVRAIIVENGKILVMHRNKYGSQYYTLVGGRINDGESPEQALVREVKEETGMTVTAATLLYIESHPDMNRFDMNTHMPLWVGPNAFAGLQFRTPQLHKALVQAFKKGFPKEVTRL